MQLFGLILTIFLLVPFPAAAQRGQQIFDFFVQGLQQLEHQQHQQQHMQRMYEVFAAHWHGCQGGDIAACDNALSYPFLTAQDRQVLFYRRAQIVLMHQEVERARRERIAAEMQERQRQIDAAREAEYQRAQHARDRAARATSQHEATPQPVHQATQQTNTRTTTLGALLLEWPPTPLSGSFMAALALIMSYFLFRSLWSRLSTMHVKQRATSDPHEPPFQAPQQAPQQPPSPPSASVPPQPPMVWAARDTTGAMAALELALAYIEEVREADRPAIDDMVGRKHQLNTLSLAAKQLGLAQRLDPDAILDVESDGVPCRFSINELKAEALLLEGTTHQVYDVKRAIPALVAATELNPHSARAFYILGLTQAANMSRAKAVAAFERAAALDPKNITYRKELNRAQNMSAAEMAAYHATRTAEKVFDNAVLTWNIFAITWNVITFPLRLVFRIFRLLRLHPFA